MVQRCHCSVWSCRLLPINTLIFNRNMNMNVFNEMISNATYSELNQMLVKLQMQINIVQPADNFDKYVSYHNDFVPNNIANGLESEFLNTHKPDSDTKTPGPPESFWYGPVSYKYTGHAEHPAREIPSGSFLEKGRELLNNTLGRNLDSCLIAYFSNHQSYLKAHADDESIFNKNSPMCNLSIGADRIMELSAKSKYSTRHSSTPSHQILLQNRSLLVMNPGCQDHLLHAIPPSKNPDDGPRIVFYYRESGQPIYKAPPSLPSHIISTNDSPVTSPTTKTSLIVGTSITRPLIPERLSKKGNYCINISQGGAKIKEVKQNVLQYKQSENAKSIDNIILSVGTNDIRNLSNVNVLEEPLKDLIISTKEAYPQSKIYFQNLLPIRLKNYYCKANLETVNKVYEFNRLLFRLCKLFEVYYIDVFKLFLNNRNPGERDIRQELYKDDVHLSYKGIAVLARKLIYIINRHSQDFHPSRF